MKMNCLQTFLFVILLYVNFYSFGVCAFRVLDLRQMKLNNIPIYMVTVPDMSNLNDISRDSRYIKQSIIDWLNQEYIEQDCHYKIGNIVEKSYIEVREMGITDPGELLMQVGSNLEINQQDFEKAFVGPWDVANKVSDIVFRMLNIELCSFDIKAAISSSSDIKTTSPNINAINSSPKVKLATNILISPTKIDSMEYNEVENESESTFYRYNILRQFLEAVPSAQDEFKFPNEIGWPQINILIGLCLGFRYNTTTNGIIQIPKLAPFNWGKLTRIPDFTDTTLSTQERINFEELINSEFPDDEASLGK